LSSVNWRGLVLANGHSSISFGFSTQLLGSLKWNRVRSSPNCNRL
jgi:hypothetical protein